MMFLGGLRLVEVRSMVDKAYYQRRKHRTVRVDKKWRKRYGFRIVSVPCKEVYQMGDRILGHPETLRRLMEGVQKL